MQNELKRSTKLRNGISDDDQTEMLAYCTRFALNSGFSTFMHNETVTACDRRCR